ncbi:MAG TPA: hypothetical protein DCY88_21970 [Cyanobacteria bacterium UBA11372]|nr:hypothetical protein [Cyanobacteria bacterium UBA11372]
MRREKAIALKKPGFLDNTFANRLKRPQALACGYTNSRPRRWAKILAGCSGSQSLYSDTMRGYRLFGEGIIKKTGFLGRCV